MKLSEILSPKRIDLDLKSKTREEVLLELVNLLRLSPPARANLLNTLHAREELGSTAVGKGIAIPHCRSLVVGSLLVAVGRSEQGIPYRSPDRKRAHLFFLIVAPPVGDPGEYLIALGSIAQVAPKLTRDKRLKKLKTPRELIDLVEELEQ
jgi:mannitol/fructose-specific phosphotransferase system IIA component (Ntr-type)